MPACGLYFLWRDPRVASQFRTGVSLHSHTMHSKENMAFLPRYAHRIPGVSQTIRKHEATFRSYYGKELDYSRAWWTPPLPAPDAEALERRQIENLLQLPALVSLTDHDCITAGLNLRLTSPLSAAPISTEWTVPLEASFIHLGIHNLPSTDATSWMEHFRAWTAAPDPDRLAEILAALHAMPGVLIVFNHPLWDEGLAGRQIHRQMVHGFLDRFGAFIHALELNGLRPWSENREVAALAAARALPVISGGDRHGREPNANVNLTQAASFAEFVAEVRQEGRSQVLFLPQYHGSLKLRCLETMSDTLRDYPEYPGRVQWSDRIYFRQDDGRVATLSTLWQGAGPGIVRNFVALLRVLESRRVRATLRQALAGRREYAL
ncbi:MAG: hypothetical protein NTX13_14020 [Acidobacteria bacterium]|nr:hypothetical protein [Acidobacteriota bacterium]